MTAELRIVHVSVEDYLAGERLSSTRHEYVETHPTLVIEVLSDSTAATDRREKRLACQATESLREYVLVRQDRAEITVYRRDAPDWIVYRFGEGERVTFASVDYAFAIDELYEKIP